LLSELKSFVEAAVVISNCGEQKLSFAAELNVLYQ